MSSTETSPGLRWRELTALSLREDRVAIENPALGKRLSASAEGFLDLLMNEDAEAVSSLARVLERHGVLVSGTGAPPADPVMQDWVRMGWQRSLEYFLWSERVEFADWDDWDDSVRNRVIEEVASERGAPPARLAPSLDRTVELPDPEPWTAPIGEVLMGRRTKRYFENTVMPLTDLSAVLATGLHSVRHARSRARTVGGAEGLLETHGIAFEFFVLPYAVEELDPGAWLLDVENSTAGRVCQGDFRQEMSEIMCGMPATRSAAATLVLVADYGQMQYRYRHERALRSLYLEAGQIAQQMIVGAEALGYGCLITPATNDRRLAELLQLPSERFAPLYTVTVGRKAARGERADSGSDRQ